MKRSKHPRDGKSDFLAELSIIAWLCLDQSTTKESDPLVVPRTNRTLLFSCSLPLSIEDIVSDDDEVGYGNTSEKGIRSTHDQFEIDIGTPRGNSH